MIDDFEWQLVSEDDWIFGKKIRGLVRDKVAEVYFDDEYDDKRGGWKWRVFDRVYVGDDVCGISPSLYWAVTEVENLLEMKEKTDK